MAWILFGGHRKNNNTNLVIRTTSHIWYSLWFHVPKRLRIIKTALCQSSKTSTNVRVRSCVFYYAPHCCMTLPCSSKHNGRDVIGHLSVVIMVCVQYRLSSVLSDYHINWGSVWSMSNIAGFCWHPHVTCTHHITWRSYIHNLSSVVAATCTMYM